MSGNEFKAWRLAQRWNQTEAAQYLGTIQANISRWERGKLAIPPMAARLVTLLTLPHNIRFLREKLWKGVDI